jgi:hypothetical protein
MATNQVTQSQSMLSAEPTVCGHDLDSLERGTVVTQSFIRSRHGVLVCRCIASLVGHEIVAAHVNVRAREMPSVHC